MNSYIKHTETEPLRLFTEDGLLPFLYQIDHCTAHNPPHDSHQSANVSRESDTESYDKGAPGTTTHTETYRISELSAVHTSCFVSGQQPQYPALHCIFM